MDRKRVVMFFIPQLGTGGSERLVLDIADRIDGDLFKPIILTLKVDSVLPSQLKNKNIEIITVNKNRRFLDFGLMFRIHNIMRERHVDVVNTHHTFALVYAFLGAKICAHRKLYHTVHSRWEIEANSSFWRCVERTLLRYVDGAIAVSEEVRAGLKQVLKVPHSRIHLMLNAIDIEKFSSNDDESMRCKLGIKEREKVIGCVGNFRSEKNHLLLIEAFALLLKSTPEARLILVGSEDFPGNTGSSVRALISELGVDDKVSFLGARDDVDRIYPVFDVYCLPSKMEGLPLSPLEAMASGVPVVGTDVMGIREIIRDNENGFLVPANDGQALADGLYSALNGVNKASIIESARIYVEEMHSLERILPSYMSLFA